MARLQATPQTDWSALSQKDQRIRRLENIIRGLSVGLAVSAVVTAVIVFRYVLFPPEPERPDPATSRAPVPSSTPVTTTTSPPGAQPNLTWWESQTTVIKIAAIVLPLILFALVLAVVLLSRRKRALQRELYSNLQEVVDSIHIATNAVKVNRLQSNIANFERTAKMNATRIVQLLDQRARLEEAIEARREADKKLTEARKELSRAKDDLERKRIQDAADQSRAAILNTLETELGTSDLAKLKRELSDTKTEIKIVEKTIVRTETEMEKMVKEMEEERAGLLSKLARLEGILHQHGINTIDTTGMALADVDARIESLIKKLQNLDPDNPKQAQEYNEAADEITQWIQAKETMPAFIRKKQEEERLFMEANREVMEQAHKAVLGEISGHEMKVPVLKLVTQAEETPPVETGTPKTYSAKEMIDRKSDWLQFNKRDRKIGLRELWAILYALPEKFEKDPSGKKTEWRQDLIKEIKERMRRGEDPTKPGKIFDEVDDVLSGMFSKLNVGKAKAPDPKTSVRQTLNKADVQVRKNRAANPLFAEMQAKLQTKLHKAEAKVETQARKEVTKINKAAGLQTSFMAQLNQELARKTGGKVE